GELLDRLERPSGPAHGSKQSPGLATVEVAVLLRDGTAEDVLEMAESVIAQTLGQAGQGGGVDAGERRQLGNRAHRCLLRLVDQLPEKRKSAPPKADAALAAADADHEFAQRLE